MKIKKAICFVIILLCIFNLSSCVSNTTSNAKNTSTNSTSENAISNKTTTSENNLKLFYFPNKTEIVRINEDGSNKVIFSVGDIDAYSIIIKNEWIYYLTAENDGNIYKIKTDGTDKTKIFCDKKASNFQIVGDWIYFSNDQDKKLYKMKTDGTNQQTLYDEPIFSFFVWKDIVYFTVETKDIGPKLFCMDADGKNIKDMKMPNVYDMHCNGSFLLYTSYYEQNPDKSTLYNINLQTLENKYITDTPIIYDINQEHYIYVKYNEEAKDNELHVADLNGKNDKIILKNTYISIAKIRNNKIYLMLNGGDTYFDGDYYSINFDGSDKKKLPKVPFTDGYNMEVNVND